MMRASYTACGLDFGYNDPSVAISVAVVDQVIYVCEQQYHRKKTNTQLIDILNKNMLIRTLKIYADSAEPARIAQMQKNAINAVGVHKKGIKESLNNLKKVKIVIHPSCQNTIIQMNNYQYKKDRQTGEYTDQPIGVNDHCIDALRYATMQYFHHLNYPKAKIIGM